MFQTIIISITTGLVSSLVASYLYAQFSNNAIGIYGIAITTLLTSLAVWTIIRLLPRLRLVAGADILGYYPKGQRQYIAKLLADIQNSETLIIIGARGLDLIGERSPIGTSLTRGWKGSIEAYLISPESTHARLRGNALAIERTKYESESRSVDSFLGVLKLRDGIRVTTYHYDSEPFMRAIILDSCAYVAFYQQGVQGRALPCYRIKASGGRLIAELRAYCNFLKDHSRLRPYEENAPLDTRSV